MTKKQKHRRNNFSADFNAGEDDFILADLDVMLDKEDPSPVPLNNFLDDEETINRLLINSGFEANDELKGNDRNSDALGIDELDLADDFSDLEIDSKSDFDEIPNEEDALIIDDIDLTDDFSGFDQLDIEPFEQTKQIPLTKANEAQNTPVIGDISQTGELGTHFNEQDTITTDKGIFNSKKSAFAIDKELNNRPFITEEHPETINQEHSDSKTIYQEESLDSLNNDAEITPFNTFKAELSIIKKQINDYENRVKKANIITYASLSFAIVALLSSVVMAVIISNVQTKVSKLTEIVSIIEEDASGITEKNSDLEINNGDPSIEQLNQKINGATEPLTETNHLQTRTSEQEKKVTLPKQLIGQSQSSLNPSKNNTIAEKKTNNTKPASGWSVNLTAYKQLSDAQKKASQLIQKGIPVKVIAVDMNNTKWYRLKVGGFKNKESADSYATKIKKSHHLNAFAVGNR